jgi:hypothetical protein
VPRTWAQVYLQVGDSIAVAGRAALIDLTAVANLDVGHQVAYRRLILLQRGALGMAQVQSFATPTCR